VVWPWLIARNRAHFLVGAISAAALATLVTFVRRRNIRFVATGAVGAALPLCMSLFHGSTAWWDCGFHFGTVHWPYMTMGLTDNLPGILAHRYGWTMEDLAAIVTTIPAHAVHHWPAEPIDVTIRQLLLAIYGTMLLLSGIGLGLHARRRDRRVLAALVTPWLMFFCFPPQIHERYLLFAAGAACLCAGVSVGMTLLGVFLSLVTFVMTLHCMMANNGGQQNPQFDQWLAQQFPRFFDSGDAAGKVFRFFEGTHPDLGWAVLLCGGIFLYFTLAQRWRATRAIQQ
ncbi:MAG TPA: hypothetical protein VLI90_15355, partial [Tepidisphaeraceae bacterium]|nr:hypothetical protein [Tepidisphaeraceae bacterium]